MVLVDDSNANDDHCGGAYIDALRALEVVGTPESWGKILISASVSLATDRQTSVRRLLPLHYATFAS